MSHYELDIHEVGKTTRVLVRYIDGQSKQPARFNSFADALTAALIIREMRIDTAFSHVTLVEVSD